MKYYAMLFGNDVAGLCTSDGLLDVVIEDHGETQVAEIPKSVYDSNMNHDKPIASRYLKRRFTATIKKSIRLTRNLERTDL